MDPLPSQIQEHFRALRESDSFAGPVAELVDSLVAGSLTKADRRRILNTPGVVRDEAYRKVEIDLLLSFFEAGISGGHFGRAQALSFELLKECFEVREGDFLRYRHVELATMLGTQLEKILEDEVIDPAEDEYQPPLQDALNLGFDQYMALCRRAFESVAGRLQDALSHEMTIAERADVERKIEALKPMIRLAELQQRTLGALY
jgi:hypothetical protein